MVANVISMSGILNFTIMNEFNAPTTSDAPIAPNMAIRVSCENQTNIEMTIALANDATEPTDRSKPSTVKDIVIPIAIMVTIEIERRMLIRLLA